MASLISRPKISGSMRETPQFRSMGFGNTSRIMLLGHADGLPLNDPYQVNDLQEAVNNLQADPTSPLLRGLLEAYNSGARDIWIMAVGPMDEYVDVVADRLLQTQSRLTIDGGLPGSYDQIDIPFEVDGGYPYTLMEDIFNFYQKYYDRLATAYDILMDYDFMEIIVPLEASFVHTNGMNFADQLRGFCKNYLENTNMVLMGVLGTRRPNSVSMVDSIAEMISTSNALSASDGNKYVTVVAGEGAVSVPQLNFTYKASIAAQVAANMATVSLDRGLSYSSLASVVNLDGFDYTTEQLDALANAKINPAIRTQKSKRGAPFQTVLLSDSTLATDGSDFWSLSQLRVVAKCSNTIRAIGYGWVGSIDYVGFKKAVFDYLSYMVKSNTIRSFSLNIERSQTDLNKVTVDIALTPFYGLRQIFFTVKVGPGV